MRNKYMTNWFKMKLISVKSASAMRACHGGYVILTSPFEAKQVDLKYLQYMNKLFASISPVAIA